MCWHLRPAPLARRTSNIMPELSTEPKGHTYKSEDNFDYITANSRERPYLCLPRQKSCSARHASVAITQSMKEEAIRNKDFLIPLFRKQYSPLLWDKPFSQSGERIEQSNTVAYSRQSSCSCGKEKERQVVNTGQSFCEVSGNCRIALQLSKLSQKVEALHSLNKI